MKKILDIVENANTDKIKYCSVRKYELKPPYSSNLTHSNSREGCYIFPNNSFVRAWHDRTGQTYDATVKRSCTVGGEIRYLVEPWDKSIQKFVTTICYRYYPPSQN